MNTKQVEDVSGKKLKVMEICEQCTGPVRQKTVRAGHDILEKN